MKFIFEMMWCEAAISISSAKWKVRSRYLGLNGKRFLTTGQRRAIRRHTGKCMVEVFHKLVNSDWARTGFRFRSLARKQFHYRSSAIRILCYDSPCAHFDRRRIRLLCFIQSPQFRCSRSAIAAAETSFLLCRGNHSPLRWQQWAKLERVRSLTFFVNKWMVHCATMNPM